MLPKPSDSYVLKEKKILGYLHYYKGSKEPTPSKIIMIMQNFQVFKNFSITSDITSIFFRIYFNYILKLPFLTYTNEMSNFLFEILQYKPKFSLNVIQLLEKLKKEDYLLNSIKGTLSPQRIVVFFLDKLSKFLMNLEPSVNISLYFEIIFYIISDPIINPSHILTSLKRLTDNNFLNFDAHIRYINNENIFFISKKIIKNFSLTEKIFKQLFQIFDFLGNNTNDFCIKDSAIIYKKLLVNLTQQKLGKIFFNRPKINQEIFVYKTAKEYLTLHAEKNFVLKNISLKKSFEERKILGFEDNSATIFGNFNNEIKNEQNLENFFLNEDCNFFESISNDDIIKVLKPDRKVNNENSIFYNNNDNIDNNINNFNKLQEKIYSNFNENLKKLEFYDLKKMKNYKTNYFLQKKAFENFMKNLTNSPVFIILPLEINLLKIKEKYLSILILFEESNAYEKIPPIFVPFLSNLSYKILLKIYIKEPFPLSIQTGYFLSNEEENIFLSKGEQIELKFEEMFLPIITNEKIEIFEYLWKEELKVKTTKILNNDQENIMKLNENNLKHFWVHQPYAINLQEKSKNERGDIYFYEDFYQIIENFDFNGEICFKNKLKDKERNQEIIISSVMILLPEKYFLIMKLAIDEFCTLVHIKTNNFRVLNYLDSFFLFWNIN